METFEREQPGVAAKGNEHPLMMKPHSQFSLEVDSHPSAPMIIAAQPVQQRWQHQGQTEPATTCTMVMSVVSTLCCCLCFGIAAIAATIGATSEIRDGQYSKARRKLNIARVFIALSIVTGSVIIVWYCVNKYQGYGKHDTDQDMYKP
ncbi:uncharacterized protein [Littorina saxatilis]|uniref:uncharacterized protein isoform X3 n=1 Tax=Littorina saxatilis TaxID=31220 RepID=UPI0038B46D12